MSQNPYEPRARLQGDLSCDVVIVGGGFTGLWTAIQLHEADPSIDIVVVEQQVVGYGASGRNGGFAMTMVGRNLHDLVRKVGPSRARATHLAMRESLREIEQFASKEGIQADIVNTGLLTVSNGAEQDIRIRQDLEAAERLGLDDFHALSGPECQELVHSSRLRLGHFEDDTLMIDPAALVRGLAGAAERRGITIFEHTPVDDLHDVDGRRVEARTPFGTVHADRAVVATNAYAYSIPQLRRFIFTVYANIIVTEQLSDEQWARIGWERRMGIEDKRVMPHFHRPTADGRILWGGRDAPFSAYGPNRRCDRDPYVFSRLEETFRWTFPQLHDVAIDRGWAGPVCGTVNCFASIGWLGRGERIIYSVGYAGHGVGPSHLAAKIVSDLLLNRQTDLLDLPMVTKRPIPLPPGPLRWVFLGGSQRVLQRVDDQGSETGLPAKIALKVLQ
jgi:glycine/D-amino acid oxidase-like deaminating enzyme